MRSKLQPLGERRRLGDRARVVLEARGHRRRARRARARCCRAAAAPTRRASCGCAAPRTRPAAARARARARGRRPVATAWRRPSRSASSASRRLRARSSRWNGRCSSTRRPSRPNAASSRRSVGSSCTPWRAQPLRHTSPAACSSSVSSGTRGRRLAVVARVGVRAREDPAQVAPALLRVDQQGDVAAVVEVDLRPVDRLDAEPLRGLRELHRAAEPVVVGQRERAVAELGRGGGQLVGQRGAVEEGEGGVGVELGVHRCEHMFACAADGMSPSPSRAGRGRRGRRG